jgi:hypothetical protein
MISERPDGQFEARFHATYKRVLTFGYTAILAGTPSTNQTVLLVGSADLGWPWGSYECGGHASPTNFFSCYLSKFDHGTFRLARPVE